MKSEYTYRQDIHFPSIIKYPMQKNIKKTTDFFKLYRTNQFHKYVMSASIAVFAAFTIVSFGHGDVDMG